MPNRLAGESSVYLQQHAHNPVDWHPWGEEAWARARREHKPVLVSIGYASCHWCHVMERECFEDEAIARVMNEHLVCIKVDREERPDVDQIYMDAVVRMTGQGGWPLNMFCTPDGRPFHGGTYFPPDRRRGGPSWPEVVEAVARVFREQGDEVEAQARTVVGALQARPEVDGQARPDVDTLGQLVAELMQRADRRHGGFGGAPKFPTPTQLEAILAASQLHVSRGDALEHLVFTLHRMARGGIYDQLGGGFHRYSTDARWLVPHFEKMLYDNGQLLRVYAEAWRQTGDTELLWPVEEAIAWLEREMRGPEGGFFASQDADSEGEEGRFFVWDPAQIEAVLGAEDARAFCDAYGVAAGGNFEHGGKSVLAHGLAGERARFAEQRRKLFEARRARVAPDTDPKHVCAWIGYAISGLATAGASFERPDWVDAARRAAEFVLRTMSDDGRDLKRIYDGKRATVTAFLDDHASLLNALLDLYRAGGEARHAESALRVAGILRERFWGPDPGGGGRRLFFTQGDDATLVFRPGSDGDGATPGAAGLAVLGLARAAALSGRADLREVVEGALAQDGPLAARVPLHLPTLVRAAALHHAGFGLALVLGAPDDPATHALAARARALLGPDDHVVVLAPDERPDWLDPTWLEGRTTDGPPTAWLCRGHTCTLPAHHPREFGDVPRIGS